ncbi:ABC transporter substrate-binding protein [Gordonia sp. HY285]|uniref:ABC transporter substrate-binding protein n=1 Tax=Gordonia liuliyuniae TaxID=2911517 RepID=UPI001F1CC402|nr:ABC transporter substrate-binding protein [Gordonia liuliyuniae]MCF8612246.1 ABC transporter substrate-binding protein [Gordonia liuliyuniae]
MSSTAAALACTATLAVGLSACGSDDGVLRTPDGSVISTTTTRFAEVNIVGAGRDYSRTCLAPTAVDPGRTDAKRIVVTDPALLDGLCALGLGPQVRAITAAPGSVPEYLGPQLAAVPAVGDTPDAAAIREAAPDLVLSTPGTAQRLDALTATGALGTARTAVVDPAGDAKASLMAVAEATNRSAAGTQRVDEFIAEAARVGRVMDASHSQVSLVRFTPDESLIEGTSPFGAQIMALVGVDRPAPQRTPAAVPMTDDNMTDADADLIYVSYAGDGGRDRGHDVLMSDEWLNLGAPTWKRVLSVNDEVWYGRPGVAAGWLVLNDLKQSLNSSSASG